MMKDFDSWNAEKKLVDKNMISRDLFFHPREIWWCSAGLNIGVEINGKNEVFERPVLIIKKFNSELIWVLPLVSAGKNNDFYFKLNHGIVKSYVVLSQIKAISTKRLKRRMNIISNSDFDSVTSKLKSWL